MLRRFTAEEYDALPEVLTLPEAARMLDISEEQLRRWAVAGTIPALQIGRMWRFSKTRLEHFIEHGG